MGQTEGLFIWRVENFTPVPVNPKEHGRFYTGDSYIILSSKKDKSKLKHDVFYWLGERVAIDEQGAAAIMAVELDDAVGGVAVQHREVWRATASSRDEAALNYAASRLLAYSVC